jgi:hypothetical protein
VISIPATDPPPRMRRGRPTTLTRLQEIEVWSWYMAKCQLGTFADKAAELGVSTQYLWGVVKRIKTRKLSRDQHRTLMPRKLTTRTQR